MSIRTGELGDDRDDPLAINTVPPLLQDFTRDRHGIRTLQKHVTTGTELPIPKFKCHTTSTGTFYIIFTSYTHISLIPKNLIFVLFTEKAVQEVAKAVKTNISEERQQSFLINRQESTNAVPKEFNIGHFLRK